ncbi:MAG: DUF6364 family protein [bacterium]
MKAKLNLTIEEELIPLCKEYARAQNMSVSQLVETLLRQVTAKEEATFSEKWRGRFQAARKHGAKYDKLAKRYLS